MELYWIEGDIFSPYSVRKYALLYCLIASNDFMVGQINLELFTLFRLNYPMGFIKKNLQGIFFHCWLFSSKYVFLLAAQGDQIGQIFAQRELIDFG
jgi:hypothetical protein